MVEEQEPIVTHLKRRSSSDDGGKGILAEV
jgi:hypothetical protein